MSHIYFNPNQDDHPHEVVGDITSERTKEIHDFKFTILKSYDPEYGNHHHYSTTRRSSSSAKCESPKMRLYKKFMKSHNNDNDDQTIEDKVLKQVGSPRENCGENSTNNNNFVLFRTCVDCSTTKTPLWRSGPHGPKSLCNACGIRQRKARRAAMAASETPCDNTNSYNISTLNNPLHQTQFVVPKMKKRSKNRAKNKPLLFSPSNLDHQTKKICFRQFALNLSNKLCLHRIFPHDEKEAAILLMALSCGIVEG